MIESEKEAMELLEQVTTIIRRRRKGKNRVVGNVQFHRGFHSANLENDRDVLVWLPPSYEADTEKTYPVLYMHDGQNIMDPSTSFTGFDWRVDETVTSLIKRDKIDEIIIVGIYNTPDRIDEYSESDKGKKYIKFIIEELKPFIDSTYRTMHDKDNTAVMGSSMGGLISFLMAWNHPDVFSKSACLSTAFHHDGRKAITMVKESEDEKKDLRMYIDHGEDGIEEGQLMFAELTLKGYKLGKELDYYYARGAEHTEAAWADRLERPLLFLFGK